MRRAVFLAAILTLFALVALPQKKRPKDAEEKPPDLNVVKMDVHREGKLIMIDGVVRNNSTRAFKGVVMYFEFLEFNERMISRKTIEVTRQDVAPGEDIEIQAQTGDMARAVHFRLDAEDAHGRYLTIDKPGPAVIE